MIVFCKSPDLLTALFDPLLVAAIALGASGCAKREAAAMTEPAANTPSSLVKDAGDDASDADVEGDAAIDDAAPDALPLKRPRR